jgi:hypothetical protein
MTDMDLWTIGHAWIYTRLYIEGYTYVHTEIYSNVDIYKHGYLLFFIADMLSWRFLVLVDV